MQSTIHKEKSNFFNVVKKIIGFFTLSGIVSLIMFLDQKNYTLTPLEGMQFLNNYEKAYVEFMNTRDVSVLDEYLNPKSTFREELQEYSEELNETIKDSRIYTKVKFNGEIDSDNDSINIDGIYMEYILDGEEVPAPDNQQKVFKLVKVKNEWKLDNAITRKVSN